MSGLFSSEDIKSRLDQLDQEKKDLETEKKKIETKIEMSETEKKKVTDSLQKATTSEKEKIMERLNILDNRISGSDNRISGIDNRISSIDKRISGIENQLLDLVKEQGRFLVYVWCSLFIWIYLYEKEGPPEKKMRKSFPAATSGSQWTYGILNILLISFKNVDSMEEFLFDRAPNLSGRCFVQIYYWK